VKSYYITRILTTDFQEAALAKESHYDRHRLKLLKERWKLQMAEIRSLLDPIEANIEALKNERRERSGALQAQLLRTIFISQ
jgi:tRNA pseudouridine32 synthase/23S rRNA pseudouridine746 synthase